MCHMKNNLINWIFHIFYIMIVYKKKQKENKTKPRIFSK